MEDSTLRIQNRLFEITEDAPAAVHFCTESLILGKGLEEQIENFVSEHPYTTLIIIDTLQKLAEDIPALNAKLEAMRSSVVNARNFIAKAKRFTDMTELTPELLRAFIAKIIVYGKSVKHSKTAPQKILIQFRDVNILDTPEHGDTEGFTELKTTPTAAEIPA